LKELNKSSLFLESPRIEAIKFAIKIGGAFQIVAAKRQH